MMAAITKKADMADRLKSTAERLAKISETIDEIRDEWEDVRTSTAFTETVTGVRDMLDSYVLMAAAAYKAEARRKAASI